MVAVSWRTFLSGKWWWWVYLRFSVETLHKFKIYKKKKISHLVYKFTPSNTIFSQSFCFFKCQSLINNLLLHISSQVVAGLPLGFRADRSSSANACFAGLSSDNLLQWPYHFKRCFAIIIDHGLCYVICINWILVMIRGYLMLSACLNSFLWKECICLAIVSVTVHNAALYMKILRD